MAEQQIGHQKSSWVLSARFPLVKWCSRSVVPALSACIKPSFLLLLSNSSVGSFTVDQWRCCEAAAYIFSSLSRKSGQPVTERILFKQGKTGLRGRREKRDREIPFRFSSFRCPSFLQQLLTLDGTILPKPCPFLSSTSVAYLYVLASVNQSCKVVWRQFWMFFVDGEGKIGS